jgi:hypothetical protein
MSKIYHDSSKKALSHNIALYKKACESVAKDNTSADSSEKTSMDPAVFDEIMNYSTGQLLTDFRTVFQLSDKPFAFFFVRSFYSLFLHFSFGTVCS